MTSFGWELRNPHKETSDWESASYRFFPNGTYESETYHFGGLDPDIPDREKGPWSVGKNGTVQMNGSRESPLRPCRGYERGYLCLGSELFKPVAAWW